VVERQELGMTCLGLNSAFPPMGDERVRRAVALSLDRNAIVLASGAVAMPSRAVIPVGMAGGAPRAIAPDRDVAEARRVLEAAGYPAGRGLPPLDFWANRGSPSTKGAADAITKNLEEVGFQVRERTAPWGQFIETVDARKAPAYLMTWVADTADRDSFLGVLFHSKGANNYLHYSDPETDRLIDAARRDMDPLDRVRLYSQVEERVGAASVLIPLFSAANVYVVRPGLRGFNLDPMGLVNLSHLSWEEPR
jgi:oligopeptide transport system substrate-binding protein